MSNSAVLVLSGVIEWRLGRLESAEKDFEGALAIDLGECEAAFDLGVVRDQLAKAPRGTRRLQAGGPVLRPLDRAAPRSHRQRFATERAARPSRRATRRATSASSPISPNVARKSRASSTPSRKPVALQPCRSLELPAPKARSRPRQRTSDREPGARGDDDAQERVDEIVIAAEDSGGHDGGGEDEGKRRPQTASRPRPPARSATAPAA